MHAQYEFPSLSPVRTLTQIVGHTKITVKYERPSARGRVIYGELVPWDEVWRTGAGWCTKISFDKPVKVGGQPIDAGTYSLFTVPGKDEWQVILNTDTTLYGSYDYDAKHDAVRFTVNSERTDRYYEALTIDFDFIPNNAVVYVSWVNTQISFEIETQTDTESMQYITNELLTGKEEDPDQYGSGASYLITQNTDLTDALVLADKMLEMGGNEGWARRIKMNGYEKLHRYDEALSEIDKAIEAEKKFDYQKEENRQRAIQEWEDHANRMHRKLKQ